MRSLRIRKALIKFALLRYGSADVIMVVLPRKLKKRRRCICFGSGSACLNRQQRMPSYDSFAMRKFTDIDFMTKAVPNKRTLCKFRHFLEENRLNKLFFDAIHRVAVQNGHMMNGRTIADTTSVNASRLAVGRAERCQGVWCVLGTAKLKFSPALLSPGKAGLVTLCCHLTGDTPSVSPLGCRLPQRGSRGACPPAERGAKVCGKY